MSDPQKTDDQGKPASGKTPAWVFGGVLVLVGIVFVVRNITGFELQNWWALFILIPAFGSLATAYSMYRRNGDRLTAASRGPLIGGLVLLALVVIFLLGIDFAVAWPILLIVAGAAVLVGGFAR